MKRFVKWIAIVLAICTLAVCLVACAPKAVDTAAKAAWVKCNRTMPLLNATDVHLDSVDYTAYKTLEGDKAYMFKFVCSYTLNGQTIREKVYYYKVVANNNASQVDFQPTGRNSYDSWTSDKKVKSFSDKETAVVAEYYETNKEAIIAKEEADRLAEEERLRQLEEEGEGEEE